MLFVCMSSYVEIVTHNTLSWLSLKTNGNNLKKVGHLQFTYCTCRVDMVELRAFLEDLINGPAHDTHKISERQVKVCTLNSVDEDEELLIGMRS